MCRESESAKQFTCAERIRCSEILIAAQPCELKFLKNVLHSEIGHLTVVFKTLFGWVVTNPQPTGLMVLVVQRVSKDEDYAPYLLKYGYRVLRITPRSNKNFALRFGLQTCVGYAKYAIGIKCFAFTPWQLWQKLVKHYGGVEVCTKK